METKQFFPGLTALSKIVPEKEFSSFSNSQGGVEHLHALSNATPLPGLLVHLGKNHLHLGYHLTEYFEGASNTTENAYQQQRRHLPVHRCSYASKHFTKNSMCHFLQPI